MRPAAELYLGLSRVGPRLTGPKARVAEIRRFRRCRGRRLNCVCSGNGSDDSRVCSGDGSDDSRARRTRLHGRHRPFAGQAQAGRSADAHAGPLARRDVCGLAGGEIGDLDAAPLNIDVSALLRDLDVEPRAFDDRRHERRLDREVRRVLVSRHRP